MPFLDSYVIGVENVALVFLKNRFNEIEITFNFFNSH